MKNKLIAFLTILIPFSLILFALQYFIVNKLGNDFSLFYSTWSVYLFHFTATLLVYIAVLFVNKTFSDKTGFAFMACGLIKMMAALVFLLPLIQNKEIDAINDVLAFFIPYFLFLLLETVYVVKILNKEGLFKA
ncbi:DUF6168 family protein [Lacinutrix sp. Bg11-31]|uniref:DUF6168 family protein n=1 Tax=Lacinutrix sp. Bg11-31 TaxID=2057808 RepID=UPI000C30607E|nr:DUF6168 family protein [Lacinutrix sp. Bg11-31]AUC82922.1 hypothetical protein CW733_12630 [Lacinutrix sp. Bg11-31]